MRLKKALHTDMQVLQQELKPMTDDEAHLRLAVLRLHKAPASAHEEVETCLFHTSSLPA